MVAFGRHARSMDSAEVSRPATRSEVVRCGTLDWNARVAGYLLSVVAVGVAINLLSEHGLPALSGVAGLAAVAGIAHWLRQYPGSALQTAIKASLWGAAAFCSAASMFTPLVWAITLTACAVAFLVVTILVAATLDAAATFLFGAAEVGAGCSAAIWGVENMLEGESFSGGALVAAGFAFALAGAAILQGGLFRFVASRIIGVIAIGGGVAALVTCWQNPQWVGDLQSRWAFVILGIGVAAIGLDRLLKPDRLSKWAHGWLSLAFIVNGSISLWDGDALFGAATLAGGLAGALLILDDFRYGEILSAVAMIGSGAAFLAQGVDSLLNGHLLFGVAVIGLGFACGMVGAVQLRRNDARKTIHGWWAGVTKDRRPTSTSFASSQASLGDDDDPSLSASREAEPS